MHITAIGGRKDAPAGTAAAPLYLGAEVAGSGPGRRSGPQMGLRPIRPNPTESDQIKPVKEMANGECRVANKEVKEEAKAKAAPPLTIHHQLPNHQPNPA